MQPPSPTLPASPARLQPGWQGWRMVESRLGAALCPPPAATCTRCWAERGQGWLGRGLTILLWPSQSFFPLATACKPRGSTGTFRGASSPSSRAAGSTVCLGKGCAFFKQYSRELFLWHMRSPEALAFKCLRALSQVCMQGMCCSRPAL